MTRDKVVSILGQRDLCEENAIEIHLFSSDNPEWPWEARAEGQSCLSNSPHKSISMLLKALAKRDRAAKEDE